MSFVKYIHKVENIFIASMNSRSIFTIAIQNSLLIGMLSVFMVEEPLLRTVGVYVHTYIGPSIDILRMKEWDWQCELAVTRDFYRSHASLATKMDQDEMIHEVQHYLEHFGTNLAKNISLQRAKVVVNLKCCFSWRNVTNNQLLLQISLYTLGECSVEQRASTALS